MSNLGRCQPTVKKITSKIQGSLPCKCGYKACNGKHDVIELKYIDDHNECRLGPNSKYLLRVELKKWDTEIGPHPYNGDNCCIRQDYISTETRHIPLDVLKIMLKCGAIDNMDGAIDLDLVEWMPFFQKFKNETKCSCSHECEWTIGQFIQSAKIYKPIEIDLEPVCDLEDVCLDGCGLFKEHCTCY